MYEPSPIPGMKTRNPDLSYAPTQIPISKTYTPPKDDQTASMYQIMRMMKEDIEKLKREVRELKRQDSR